MKFQHYPYFEKYKGMAGMASLRQAFADRCLHPTLVGEKIAYVLERHPTEIKRLMLMAEMGEIDIELPDAVVKVNRVAAAAYAFIELAANSWPLKTELHGINIEPIFKDDLERIFIKASSAMVQVMDEASSSRSAVESDMEFGFNELLECDPTYITDRVCESMFILSPKLCLRHISQQKISDTMIVNSIVDGKLFVHELTPGRITQDMALKIVRFSPDNIQFMPSELITAEMVMIAIKHSPFLISNAPDAAILPEHIDFVINSAERPFNLVSCHLASEDQLMRALKLDAKNIENISKSMLTKEMCDYVFTVNKTLFRFMPVEHLEEPDVIEHCLANPWSFEYACNGNYLSSPEELALQILESKPEAIKLFPLSMLTEPFIKNAINIAPGAFEHLKKDLITDELRAFHKRRSRHSSPIGPSMVEKLSVFFRRKASNKEHSEGPSL